MQYPLAEKIGVPELLVGRAREFDVFGKWLDNIPRRLSKSRVILARRKSGKTVFVQRLFNQVWNANGSVIPFYFDFAEKPIWYPDLAVKYYQTFASQYISFLERDTTLVQTPLSLEEIRAYGQSKGMKPIVRDVDLLVEGRADGKGYDLMWDAAYSAPHRYADVYDRRAVVILDEFQNISLTVYMDRDLATKPLEAMAGSYHYYSESKLAPMLVTGSYVGWLMRIINKYLEAGRLKPWHFTPYLTPEAGLEAVYKYAEVYQVPITNATALLINELCMADPFFISCVIQSDYPERDLTTRDGVVNTVNHEITDRTSEMSGTWNEYIQLALLRINHYHTKQMLLHLSKHADRYWTPRELKAELQIELTEYEIQDQLVTLAESDLIERGTSDIQFRGLQDGTVNLILRNRFEEEINNFVPNLKDEFQAKVAELQQANRRLQGMLNHLSGKLAEQQLATELRTRKRFPLSDYFTGINDDAPVNLVDVRERVTSQRADGKGQEFDVVAQSSDGRVLLVEVRKRQSKTTLTDVVDFWDKVTAYATTFPQATVRPAFLALGGFTEEAAKFCNAHNIGMAEQITYFWSNL